MATEKVVELFKDKDFLEALDNAESFEAAQGLFASKGVEITIDELKAIRAKMRQEAGEELTDDELALAAGGAGDINLNINAGDVIKAYYDVAGDVASKVGGAVSSAAKKIFSGW